MRPVGPSLRRDYAPAEWAGSSASIAVRAPSSVVGSGVTPNLPANALDAILVVDVYPEVADAEPDDDAPFFVPLRLSVA